MNRKLLILPLIAIIFLSAIPYATSQAETSIISMKGTNWTLKVDANIQTAEILSPIQVTAKSSTEKELSIIVNDIKEVPEFTAKFKVDTTGLTIYKQLPLTQELNASEYNILNATHAIREGETVIHRPENVLNSFACFDQTGKKVAHIYGSKLIDSKGAYIWIDQELKDGILTVMLDPKWMETATYPVTLDPTFGYTTAGGTETTLIANNTNSQLETLTATTTQLIYSITIYGKSQAASVSGAGIYTDTGVLIAVTQNITGFSGNPGWWNFLFATPQAIYDGNYFLSFASTSGSIYYDAAVLQNVYRDSEFLPATINGDVTTLNNRRYSIYATYMEQTATPTPAATPIITDANFNSTMLYTSLLIAIICLNLLVGYYSKGFVVPATFGIISVSIAVAAFFTAIYGYILFTPWLPLILLSVAIFNIFEVIRKVRN